MKKILLIVVLFAYATVGVFLAVYFGLGLWAIIWPIWFILYLRWIFN